MNTVQHYVSGDIWAGTSDRFVDVYNPATGAVTAQVALGGAADVNHAVAAAKAGAAGLGRDAAGQARRGHVRLPQPAEVARRGTGRNAVVRTRQDPAGRARRDGPRHRGGGVSPAGFPSCSRANIRKAWRAGSTVSRSASRSASSPASRRSTSRPWCRCGCIRCRSPAATPSCSSRRSAIRRSC